MTCASLISLHIYDKLRWIRRISAWELADILILTRWNTPNFRCFCSTIDSYDPDGGSRLSATYLFQEQ